MTRGRKPTYNILKYLKQEALVEHNERRKAKGKHRFDEKNIALALGILEKIERPLDLLFYLMRREDQRSLVLMLLSANEIDMDTFIKEAKRDTDLLYEVDKERNIYVMICQDTRIDGGYRFAERLWRQLEENHAKGIHLAEVEINSKNYRAKEVIYRLMELFFVEPKEGEKRAISYYAFS